MYKVIWKGAASKQLAKIDRNIAKKIKDKLKIDGKREKPFVFSPRRNSASWGYFRICNPF